MSDLIAKSTNETNSGIFVTDEVNKSFVYEAGDGTVIHVQSSKTRYDRKNTIKICSETNNINATIQFESNEDFRKFCDLLDGLK